ncbi:15441_t:CDS:2 [Funneliformis geosporum]|uniref:13318_t:CDS:1 n=1 Tax=Funneliformis geosporum TaxID=1117311 RepID=A0A9W4WNU2_9GLOM|nr:13318_t:CDS:2 [Funneliformis geosporum]CAI2176813.1 15441_t:CDS:2 [Funneliformis geosporum]
MSWKKDIRVVVGIDFGTTYSGFSYCHVASDNKEIITNDQWPDNAGQFKTNTVLQYDKIFENVEKWGKPALSKRSRRGEKKSETRPVELFKLHLGNLDENLRPKLPIKYKKAITDYLEEIGKLIRNTLKTHWDDVDLFKNVLLVLSVPAEYSEKEKAIMRKCAYNAKLIDDKYTQFLQFTTEPEAAAVYCMENCLKEYDSTGIGTTFMIVDCGGGTVDLTTRKLVGEKKVGEVTERAGDYCGSTFIDQEFLKYLGNLLGHSAIDKLKGNNYKQLQYMVQKFCRHAKLPFTGEDKNFHYELDLLDTARELQQYVTDSFKKSMDEKEWIIDINYDDIKSMFDPIIDRILNLITVQLKNCRNECSTMFLVGGFSQSAYLQSCIKLKFKDRVKTISVPTHPIAAIVRGATLYGLGFYNKINNLENGDNVKCILTTRVLKFTYGIEIFENWKSTDPKERKNFRGDILKFHRIAKRGEEIEIDKEIIVRNLCPIDLLQKIAVFSIYYTREYDAEYCDEPGMELLGKLKINFPNSEFNRNISFGLSFGSMEITATAKNETNGQNYLATFEIDKEND